MTRAETLEAAAKCVCGDREEDYEVWAAIPGIDGYEVSNMGRVRSLARKIVRCNGRVQTIKERILRAGNDEWGYPQVGLHGKTYKVHRLVAMAFMPPKLEGQEIRHLDGNAKNAQLSNLAYGSHSANVLDMYEYRGYLHTGQKLSEVIASQIKSELSRGEKNRELARKYGVSEQTICDIKHGRIYARVGG